MTNLKSFCRFIWIYDKLEQPLCYEKYYWHRLEFPTCIYTWVVCKTKAELILERKVFFHSLSHMRISVFWGHECLSDTIDRNQKAIQERCRSMSWKKFNFKTVFMLMTHNSIGHLNTLYMNVLISWAVALSLNGNATAHCSALIKCKHFSINPA